ncbi:DUF6075 family protein [Marinilactibacillus psychrotolerans]|uniref:DUF6075 family protein n=1 Tax=Marinilactibacillus psychrotolerans TaxID=191770 RepID=UPI001865BCE4|nr:DUF6075 family protein [Marinilactibacillus psychrotolerans]
MKDHEQRYLELLAKDGTDPTDTYRKALFYLFSGNSEIYSKIDSLYDFKNRSIEFDSFEKTDFSNNMKHMIELGFNLYNGYPSADPATLFSGLDQENSKLCLEAIQVRFDLV